MVERDVFSLKPKLQYHLSQRGECVYGSESPKKGRLLRESVVVQIDEQTLILKMVEREVFLIKPKHEFICHNKGNEFMVPSH